MLESWIDMLVFYGYGFVTLKRSLWVRLRACVWVRLRALLLFFRIPKPALNWVFLAFFHHHVRLPDDPFIRQPVDGFILLICSALMVDGNESLCQQIIDGPGEPWLADTVFLFRHDVSEGD